MKRMTNIKLSLSLIFIVFLISCSSNQTRDSINVDTITTNSSAELYADLTKTKKGWRLTNISPYRSGRNVVLGSYSYLGSISTDPEPCIRGIFSLTSGNCTKLGDPNFINYSPVPLNAANVLVWPIWLMVSPLLIVASKGEGHWDTMFFPVFVRENFNWNKYKKAVNKAKKSDDFDKRFVKLYKEYVALVNQTVTPKFTTNNAAIQTKLHADKEQAERNIRNYLNQSLNQDVPLIINDRSGLANKVPFNQA